MDYVKNGKIMEYKNIKLITKMENLMVYMKSIIIMDICLKNVTIKMVN